MSVMGHSGPWRDYSGFGPTVQAFSGLTYLTAYPGGPPLGMGYSYADHVAGLYASLALLGALEFRRRTGQGRFIDLSQTETMVSLLCDAVLEYTRNGQAAEPVGNRSDRAAPHGVYPCAGHDEWCAIAVYSEDQWKGFKQALENLPWADEERFATLSSRLKHSEALDNLVSEWTQQYPAGDLMAKLQKAGVPAGVVRNAAGLAGDQQLQSRGFYINLDHPQMGCTIADASPIRLSHSPAEYRRPAPVQGQDNDYVYGRLLGLNENEINRLRRENII
jgi:benzylsuccinate CoA-transferase BbsF subunit